MTVKDVLVSLRLFITDYCSNLYICGHPVSLDYGNEYRRIRIICP